MLIIYWYKTYYALYDVSHNPLSAYLKYIGSQKQIIARNIVPNLS